MDADRLEKLLNENGLSVVDQPISFDDVEDEAKLAKTVAFCRRFNVDFLYIPWFEAKTAAEWRAFCRRLDAAEAKLSPYGIRVGYHHHIHELTTKVDGEYPWDILTGPDGARLEMDIGPVLEGGRNPAEEIAKMKGRLPSGIHAKPLGATAAGAAGDRQDWPKVVAAAEKSGVKWLVVECEKRQGTFDDIAESARRRLPPPAASRRRAAARRSLLRAVPTRLCATSPSAAATAPGATSTNSAPILPSRWRRFAM